MGAPISPTGLPDRISFRTVFGLAWPVMISMLSYTAMSVIDTAFVARLGTDPVAGIGLAIPVVFLFQTMGVGLLIGAKVAIAQRTGAGADDRARRLAWHAAWLALGLGVVVAAIAPLGPQVFTLMGVSGPVAEEATAFFSIRILGAVLIFVSFAANAWFQGRGDMRTPMVGALIGNAVNIALDPFFIFGWGSVPSFGVAGAALSTLFGLGANATFLWWRAWPALRTVPRRLERDLLAEIWHLGLPISVRQTLGVGSFAVFTALLGRVGAIDLAAHIIAIRIVSVSFLPGHAVSEAASVLVGQAVGAARPDLARRAWSISVRLAMFIMAAWAVIFMALPEWLILPFGAQPEVLELTIQLLAIAALFQVFDAVAMVALGVLNGAGDTRFAMVSTVGVAWLVNVPLAWLLAIELELGAVGAWLSLTAEISVLAAVSLWRLRGDAWLEKGLAAADSGGEADGCGADGVQAVEPANDDAGEECVVAAK